jgi:PIN domain nuclease of toxin-antitoxin system
VILLDTHILLSALGQVDLVLPAFIQNELMELDGGSVSVVSIWEIAIKNRIGKLHLYFPVEKLPIMVERQNLIIIDITAKHTLADIGPEPITKDPFDRLLLGVCAAEGMKLLTIDKALVDHPLAWR